MSKYAAKHHSQSINKWTKEIEDRFEIDAEGTTPTDRINDALDQLEEIIASGGTKEELRSFIKTSVIKWYKIGAKRGAAELLKDLMWYEVLPDDIEELKNSLEEPLKESDALLWSTILRYKKVDEESAKVRATVKVPYKSIIRKLENIK